MPRRATSPDLAMVRALRPIIEEVLMEINPDILKTTQQLKDEGKSQKANCLGDDKARIYLEIAKRAFQRKVHLSESTEGWDFSTFKQKDICDLLKRPTAGSTTRLTHFLATEIRDSKYANTVLDVPLRLAEENLAEGRGPFKDIQDDYIAEARQRIGMLISNGKVDGLAADEAEDVVLEILRQYDLEYIWFLTLPQHRFLVEMFVREKNTHRPSDVEDSIRAFHTSQDPKYYELSLPEMLSHPLHDQEKNEIVAMMDPIIKTKGACLQIEDALKEGKLVALELWDYECNDVVLDVYGIVPSTLEYEICQGAAFRRFGDYKAYAGHEKEIEPNRYLFGLTTATVYDLDSPYAAYKGGSDGIPIVVNGKTQIMREVAYTCRKDDPGYQITISQSNFTLHRFIGIAANSLGISIHAEGVLEKLGIALKGTTYDDIFAYRPLNNSSEAATIARALRVGDAHSRQCDIDHWYGRQLRSNNSILMCGATSHRHNICLTYARKNAGHWCNGLIIGKYVDGNKCPDVTNPGQVVLAVPEDILIQFPTADGAKFDGSIEIDGSDERRKLQEIDPLRDLDPIKPSDIGLDDVDCDCKNLPKGSKSKCKNCTYRLSVKSGNTQKRTKGTTKKRKKSTNGSKKQKRNTRT